MSHAELSPSGAHRWMNCPGSIALCRGIESEDNVYSREGTFAHEIAAKCLQHGMDASACVNMACENGQDSFFVTEEMADHIQTYLDAVRSTLMIEGGELLIEQKVAVTKKVYGTADAIIVGEETLHVFDFKYGRGVFVDADENEQLLTYALGSLLHTDAATKVQRVAMHIVQPRCPADRVWRSSFTSTARVAEEWAARIYAAEKACSDPNAPVVPGEWCHFCPAKPNCPALRERAMETARSVFTDLTLVTAPVKPPSPANLTPEQIATVLRGTDLVEAWLKGVNEMAFDMLKRGVEVPGYKLVEKRGNRKWNDPAIAELALATNGLVEPYAPRELLSPAQAEKALAKVAGKGPAEKLVESLAHKPVTGATIVPASDPRPALLTGASVFTPV